MNLLLRFTLEPGSTKETPNNPQSLLHNKDDPKHSNDWMLMGRWKRQGGIAVIFTLHSCSNTGHTTARKAVRSLTSHSSDLPTAGQTEPFNFLVSFSELHVDSIENLLPIHNQSASPTGGPDPSQQRQRLQILQCGTLVGVGGVGVVGVVIALALWILARNNEGPK